MEGRVIIVGERNCKWSTRLMQMSGLTGREFFLGTDRLHLAPEPGRWDAKQARHTALLLHQGHRPSAVFCLGPRVAAAFGADERPWQRRWSEVLESDLVTLALIPMSLDFEPEHQEWIRVEFERLRETIEDWTERRFGLMASENKC